MAFGRSFSVSVLSVLLTGTSWAAQNSRYLAEDLRDSFSVTQTTTSVGFGGHDRISKSPVQFVLPSFVIHGIQPDPSVAQAMPRRLADNGDAVVTPGFGLEYKSQNGLLLMGAMIKDCFNNLAGTLQIGFNSRIDRESNWGFTVGFYARETPLVCTPGQGCSSIDDLPFKYTTNVNGESVDIIPLPFIHYSYALYQSRDLQINFKFMGNFFLNEFGLEFPI